MHWITYKAAKASLREFSPAVRVRHTIVRVWSESAKRWIYCRVFKETANGLRNYCMRHIKEFEEFP